MIAKNQHASEHELQRLLFDADDSDASTEIAIHVETCELCQQRLHAIISSDPVEQEASLLLVRQQGERKSRLERTSSDHFNSLPVASEDAFDVDDILEPPTHPEMLGRVGRYEIERCIGSGGMGIVFKGHDSELQRPVAIKILLPHLARNGAARQRFGRESRAAAAIVHEHVVAIHNVESNGKHPYLVMQYVAGESLQTRVDREGPLSVEQILRIGIQTASGLEAAHEQGIVHRDVKPANILLEDNVDRALITDFGLARTVDDASLTQTGVVAGTPHYMSPEQANGDEVDYRTDLFSLGSVLYFMATGHPPFRAERAMGVLHRICREKHRSVWQVNSAIPDELSDTIDRLLDKRPSFRWNSASNVRDALTRILQQRQSRQPRWSTQLRRFGRRNRIPLWSFAILLLLASTTYAVSRWYASRWSISSMEAAGHATERTPTTNRQPESTFDREVLESELRDRFIAAASELAPNEPGEFTRRLRELHQAIDLLNENPRASHDSNDDLFRSEIQRLEQQLRVIEPPEFNP